MLIDRLNQYAAQKISVIKDCTRKTQGLNGNFIFSFLDPASKFIKESKK